MNNCLNCGKDVPQTEGRRARLYCSNSCRQKKWQSDQRIIKLAALAARIPLPEGYVDTSNIGVLETNGTITPIAKFIKAKNKPNPSPKTEKPAEPTQKKEEAPKEAAIPVKSFRTSKEYDNLIRTSNERGVLETLQAELPLNEMVTADQKKAFNTRIEFKLKRL